MQTLVKEKAHNQRLYILQLHLHHLFHQNLRQLHLQQLLNNLYRVKLLAMFLETWH
jgi:hypothetical protein